MQLRATLAVAGFITNATISHSDERKPSRPTHSVCPSVLQLTTVSGVSMHAGVPASAPASRPAGAPESGPPASGPPASGPPASRPPEPALPASGSLGPEPPAEGVPPAPPPPWLELE